MKANYRNKKSEEILLSGHGEEWSKISNDISEHTKAWLAQSGISDCMMKDILTSDNISIEVVRINDLNGVALIVGNVVVGSPFIYDNRDGSYDADLFVVDCTLLFSHLKSEFAPQNNKFGEAIKLFYSNALDNAKLLCKM